MNDNNNQNLIQLVETTQHNQKIQSIIAGIGTGLSLITTGLVAWKSFKPPQASPKVRLIRLERQKQTLELKNKNRLAIIDLKIAATKAEIHHETQLAQFGAGLNQTKQEIKETITNQTQNLKEQGKEFLNEKAQEAKDKLKDLKDQILK